MRKFLVVLSLFSILSSVAFAQRKKPKVAPRNTIFALLNDGKTLEPIAFIKSGKLMELGEEASGENSKTFAKNHYKPKTSYNVIFGGKTVGTASVKKDFVGSDCAANQAEVSLISKTCVHLPSTRL